MKTYLLIGLLAVTASSFAKEAKKTGRGPASLEGSYVLTASLRFSGYSREDCAAENGRYIENEQACLQTAENSVVIEENQNQQTFVRINVVFGPANMRSFAGVVTQSKPNVLKVKEAEISDSGAVGKFMKGGCALTVTVKDDVAMIALGDTCDANLRRASGAARK